MWGPLEGLTLLALPKVAAEHHRTKSRRNRAPHWVITHLVARLSAAIRGH